MNKKDYAKMKYNFHSLKKGESIFDLGDLSPFKDVFSVQTEEESDLGLDPEFVMKYVILMNSIGSPFIEKYPRLGYLWTTYFGGWGSVHGSVFRYYFGSCLRNIDGG